MDLTNRLNMKISIVITEGGKQIMLTPETDHEKQALKLIDTSDVLRVVSKMGTFGQRESSHVSYQVAKCQGGYYHMFPEEDSLMFVIDDNEKEVTK